MRRKRLKVYQRVIINWVVFLFILFIAGTCYFEFQMRPILKSLTINSGQSFATDAVNTAVQDVLDRKNYTYDDLVSIDRSQDGVVQCISANAEIVNQLKAEVTLQAQKNIGKMKQTYISTRIGGLTGVELLKGIGPKISVCTALTGGVCTEIVSKLAAGGINQTLHTIELHIKADISVYSTGTECDTSIETNVMIAQTVVVGEVPQLLYADEHPDMFINGY